jgi:hypothetical protein
VVTSSRWRRVMMRMARGTRRGERRRGMTRRMKMKRW